VLELRKKAAAGLDAIKPEAVERIVVYTYSVSKKQNDLPLPPENPVMAQFNMPFLAALAFLKGNVYLNHFSRETISDTEILSLAKKVRVEVDPEIEKLFPKKWGCRVEIHTADGRKLSVSVDAAKGDVANPMSQEDLLAKFFGLLSPIMPEDDIHRIRQLVEGLEDLEDASVLPKLLGEIEVRAP